MGNTCESSDMLAASLLLKGGEVSDIIIEQLRTMDLAKKVGNTTVHNIAESELKSILDVSILQSNEASAIAKMNLAKDLSRNTSLATKKNIERLLNTLDNMKSSLSDLDKFDNVYKAMGKGVDEGEKVLREAIDNYQTFLCKEKNWNNIFKVANKAMREGTKKISAEDKRKGINKFLKGNINDLIDKGIINIDNKELYIKDIDSKIKRLKKERDDYIAKNGGKVKKGDTTITDLSESIERYTEIKNTINKDKRLEKDTINNKRLKKSISTLQKEIEDLDKQIRELRVAKMTTGYEEISEELKTLDNKIQEKEKAIKKAETKLSKLKRQDKKDEVSAYIESLRKEINELNNKYSDLVYSQSNIVKGNIIDEQLNELQRLRREKQDEYRETLSNLGNKQRGDIVTQASGGIPDHFWDYLEHKGDFKENFIERDFRNGRTMQEIAEHYGIPVFVVDLYKYGSTYGLTVSQTIDNRLAGVIVTIREDAERGILHHECFHAISKLMDGEQYLSLLKDMQQNLGFDAKTSEEMLADMFFEYFKTGKINTPFKEIKNTQSRILSFFKRLKDLLLGKTKITLGDELKKKISQFYDDILDGKIAKEYESFNNDFGDIVKELEEEGDFYGARWYGDDENLKFLDEAGKFSDKVDAMKKNAKNRVTDEFDVNDTIENIKKQVEDKLEKLQNTFDRELTLPDTNIKLDDVIDSIDVDELTNTINKVLDDYSDYIIYKDKQDILYYFDTITSGLKTLKEGGNTEFAKDLANTDVGFVSFLRRKLGEIENAISTVNTNKAEELNDLVGPILNLEEIVRTGRYTQYESTFSKQQNFVQSSMERYATILNAIEGGEVNTIEEINKLNKEILGYNDELSEETSKYSYSNRGDIDTEWGYYSADNSDIYGDNFKNWFGDWENNPENASKVVDENGKPMVMYHGSDKDFNEFSSKFMGTHGTSKGMGFYFTPSKGYAEGYGNIKEVYLDMKKPISTEERTITRGDIENFIRELYNKLDEDSAYYFITNFADVDRLGIEKGIKETVDILDNELNNADIFNELVNLSPGNYDVIANTLRDTLGYDGIIKDGEYVVFNADQIKSATDNVGTYDRGNLDIRYSRGQEDISQQTEYIDNIVKADDDDIFGKADVKDKIKNIKDILSGKKDIDNMDATYILARELLGEDLGFNQYVTARVLLSEGSEVAEGILKGVALGEIMKGALSVERIKRISTLEELASIAFSYTDKFKDNEKLLKAFMDKKDALLSNAKDDERLFTMKALQNIAIYGDSYYSNINYDLFVSRMSALGYNINNINSRELYRGVAKSILAGEDYKRVVTRNGKEVEEVIIPKDELTGLMLAYMPGKYTYSTITDLINVAGYDDVMSKIKRGLKEGSDVDLSGIFDEAKLDAIMDSYRTLLEDPDFGNRNKIILKAISNKSIDTSKTIFIGNKERKIVSNENILLDSSVKSKLYSKLGDSSSIIAFEGMGKDKMYKDVTSLPKDYDFEGVEYVIVESTRSGADAELIDRINKINESRKEGHKIEIIDNKYLGQGRFYRDGDNLKFSLISDTNMREFEEVLGDIGIEFKLRNMSDKEIEQLKKSNPEEYNRLLKEDEMNIVDLQARFNRYITSLYGEGDTLGKVQKIQGLLGSFFMHGDKDKYLKSTRKGLEVDVYELDRYIDQSLNTTGKYKIDVINLGEARNSMPDDINGYKVMADVFSKQLGLEFDVELAEGLDLAIAKELCFSAMYNNNIVEGIRARYAFLKYMGVTGTANEVDKVIGINYIFNKVLKDEGYNMGILQSDEFISKLINGEDVSNDVWRNNFIRANSGNPTFKQLPGSTLEEKFNTLVDNIKDSIGFDSLKERLTFPGTYKEGSIQFMKHEGEEAVYKMLYNTNADKQSMIQKLDAYGYYLGKQNGNNFKNIDETKIVLDIIDDYISKMRDIWEGKTPGGYKAALELKDELEFVLNTIDNKIYLPKYGSALDQQGISMLSRIRSQGISLNVSKNEGNIQSFINDMNALKNDYRNIGDKIDKRRRQIANMSPEERMDTLRETGVVYVDDGRGNVLPLTADDMVEKLIKEINEIEGRTVYSEDIENLLVLSKDEISRLSTEQKISIAKKLAIIQKDVQKKTIMEQIYSQLNHIFATTRFFQRYKLGNDGYPQLFSTENLSLYTDAVVTQEDTYSLLKSVYDSLMADYFTEGKVADSGTTMEFGDTFVNPTLDDIRDTVSELVGRWNSDLTNKQANDITERVTAIFAPYSQLESLPKEVEDLVKEKVGEPINPMLAQLGVTKDSLVKEFGKMLLTSDDGISRSVTQMLNDGEIGKPSQSLGDFIRNGNGQKVEISNITRGQGGLNAPTEKELYDKIQRATNTAISVMDNFTKVTDLDRAAASDAMWGVRDLFESNVFLKRFADTDDLMRARASDVGTNLRSAVIGRWTSTWQEVFPRFRALGIGGNLLQSGFKEERWKQVVAYYNKYYGMNFNEVMALNADKLSDPLESSALQMAQYFKQVENMLGSPNGLRGVTTDMATNIAFYNIGDCVNYVKTAEGFIALTSGIQQNQFLKFMKLNKEGSRGYSEFFNRISQTTTGKRQFGNVDRRSRREIRNDLNNTLLGNNMSAEDFSIFKQMFGLTEDYEAKDADRIVAALGGFKANNWWNRTMGRFLSGLGKSSLIMRMLTSYPGGLMTIGYQQVGYEVRRDALTKGLGVSSSDLSKWASLRKSEGMMTDTYFEMPNFRGDVEDIERIREMFNSLYEDVDSAIFDKIMKESHLKKGDSGETAYAKILQALENTDVKKFLDNTKENANNIIDGINAKAMKDIAFAQAVLTNDMYKFYSPEDYMKFMFDKNIDADLKARVRQAIEIKAQRSFSDLMGLSGTSTMAQITNGTFGDFLMSMYNIINFRGQWGTVILRQTITRLKELFGVGGYVAKNLGKPGLADEVSAWVMKTPEMQNFIYGLVGDVYWTFKAAREMERNDPDKEWEFQDALDLLSFTSMRMQGLSSGALGRMFFKGLEQAEYATHYGDYSLENILGQTGYAILQSFIQNFGRNFKLDAFITDGLMVWMQYGNEEQVWNYITDQFFNLSQGSLRYMMDSTNYDSWINLGTERGPRYYVMGTATNKDNQFLNARDIAISFNSIVSGINQMGGDNVEESTDLVGATYSLLNQSKIFKTIENLKGAVKGGMRRASGDEEQKKANINERKNIYTIDQFDDIVKTQRIAKQIENSGYFTPKTGDQVNSLSKAFMNAKVPGGGSFLTMLKNRVEGITDPGDYLEENKDCKLLLDKLGEKNVKDIYKTLTDMYADKKTDSKDVRYKEIMMISQIVDSELSEDPQFPELQKILYKGVMQLNYDLFEDNEYQKFKESELASGKKSKDIINKTNWLKLDGNEQRIKTQYVNDHNKEWADVDSKTYLNVAFESMYLENPDAFKGFIDYKGFDNKPQIKSRWRRDYEMALKANDEFDRGLGRDGLNTMSLVIKYSDYKDPSGIAGGLAIKDTLQYIDEMPGYSFADKANLKAKLAIENYSILKKLENTEDYLGKDNYIFGLASDILYNADQHLAQAIQELTQAYEAGNDGNKKKGGTAGTLRALKANKIKLDDLQGGNRGTVRGNGGYNGLTSLSSPKINGSEFLRWVNQKRKKATSTNAVDFSVKKYTDVPLIAQPKDLGKPKKIKGRKTTTKKSTYKSPTA